MASLGSSIRSAAQATSSAYRRLPIRWRLAGGSAALTLVILCGFAAIVGVLTTRRIQSDFSRQVVAAADELQREVKLKVAEGFSNGEGGVCAPVDGRIVLGTGSPNRLVLDITGDSCQDGAGPLPASSFTTLTRFTVKYGTGTYAGARGSGVASFAEDAADHDRMTLIGQISR